MNRRPVHAPYGPETPLLRGHVGFEEPLPFTEPDGYAEGKFNSVPGKVMSV